jgi:hypothetical protein
MAFRRLYPVPSAHHAIQRSQLLESGVIWTRHRRHPCAKDLAPSGDFWAGERTIRFAWQLSVHRGDRHVLTRSQFPQTRDHIAPQGLSSQREGVGLVWTIPHSTS